MQDRTTLIIAHRLVMAQKADQIIVLDDGRIRQTGTHEDLLSRKGLYRQLYTSYVGETLAGGFYS